MCLLWLTRFPKHLAGVELRALVLMLLKIESSNDRLHWINQLINWYNRHKDYLAEKTYNENTGRYWYKPKTPKALLLYHQKGFTQHVSLSQ